MGYRAYSGPRGASAVSALEKERLLYKEFATLDDEPDRNAARAAAIRRTLGSIARQAAMDPADGMGL